MKLSKEIYKEFKTYPEKVLQFGEGNFLRAFADWIIDSMNDKGIFNGSVVVIKPTPKSHVIEKINEQDGLFTLFTQGIKEGRVESCKKIINSISRGIDPYLDYESFLKLAENGNLRFIISNTTEAGIAFDESDEELNKTPHKSFPAKLTAIMYHRFLYFNGSSNKGFIIIPCELIEENGDKLKQIVLKYANLWKLEKEFIDWIENDNVFCNTLVDRIVPGFPKDNIEEIQKELGYEDELVDVCEQFHLWIIEGPKWIEKEFPASSIGLNVKFVDDATPYRQRKVRILNGAHTSLVPVAYLYGIDTVREAVEDEVIGKYIRQTVFDEIIPTLNLEEDELKTFANDVFDRFKNPFIKHNLMSISLNSMSKYETRVLPSLLEYKKINGYLPKHLVFSIACLIEFYKGFRGNESIALNDDEDIIELFKSLWKNCDGSYLELNKLVTEVLEYEKVWKMDLNKVDGLNKTVTDYLYKIENGDFAEAVKEII